MNAHNVKTAAAESTKTGGKTPFFSTWPDIKSALMAELAVLAGNLMTHIALRRLGLTGSNGMGEAKLSADIRQAATVSRRLIAIGAVTTDAVHGLIAAVQSCAVSIDDGQWWLREKRGLRSLAEHQAEAAGLREAFRLREEAEFSSLSVWIDGKSEYPQDDGRYDNYFRPDAVYLGSSSTFAGALMLLAAAQATGNWLQAEDSYDPFLCHDTGAVAFHPSRLRITDGGGRAVFTGNVHSLEEEKPAHRVWHRHPVVVRGLAGLGSPAR